MKKKDEISIKKHWDTQATESVEPQQVTLRDVNQRQMEINLICKYLDKRDKLLEIGCGNGYSTKFFAKEVTFIYAIDYSSKMIERATRESTNLNNVKFEIGDVLDLKYAANTFDAVVVERCLINLTSWEKQKNAIKNIAHILKPGGRLLFIEGSENGLIELNKLRDRVGLPPIITVDYNHNFNEELLIQTVEDDFDIVAIHKFGVYDFISRIIHPMLVYPNEPAYNAKINEIAFNINSKISGFEKLSRIIGLILKKKG